MKTIILKLQIKIDEEKIHSHQTTEDLINNIITDIETPVLDINNKPVDWFKKYGYEVMVLDSSDKNID